jgi:hypothetical protein
VPATILITANDRAAPDGPAKWLRGQILLVNDVPYTDGGEADLNFFVQFTITDKNPSEVDEHLFGEWNRLIDMNVINGPSPTGFRRINVRNNNTNVSETIGDWTVQQTENIIAIWNAGDPSTGRPPADLATVGFPQYGVWTCEGTFTTGQAAEFEATIIAAGFEFRDKQRIFYINEAGMLNIEGAGGLQSGTAAQLSNAIQDGRLL